MIEKVGTLLGVSLRVFYVPLQYFQPAVSQLDALSFDEHFRGRYNLCRSVRNGMCWEVAYGTA